MVRLRSGRAASIGACVLALPLAVDAQIAPTFDEVVFATVPTDAGGQMSLTMDVYVPPPTGCPTPLVVWIHGGGWQGGTHNSVPGFALALLDEGIAVASVAYRLSGQAIFPSQIHDVKGAIRFLRANAATFNIDAQRIAAWGSSAGGHLTALLATSGDLAAAEGTTGGNLTQSSRIVAAVDYFGPTDILVINLDVTTPPGGTIDHDAPTSPESRLIGFDEPGQGIGVLRANQDNPNPPFPEKMALVILANPVVHVDAADPPLFIAHGTADTTVPLFQSTRLFDALSAAGVPVDYRVVSGAGHGNLGAVTNNDAAAFLVSALQPLADADNDGILDSCDNCPAMENPDQSDHNGNGIGDVCEAQAPAMGHLGVSTLAAMILLAGSRILKSRPRQRLAAPGSIASAGSR